MKDSKTVIPHTAIIKLKMPHFGLFNCFDDDEITMEMEFRWKRNTEVQEINFTIINKKETVIYKINDIVKCEEGGFYRVNLVDDIKNPRRSNFTVDDRTLGLVDMGQNNYIYFLFNCVTKLNLNDYLGYPCKINPDKPGNKDGVIIVSI